MTGGGGSPSRMRRAVVWRSRAAAGRAAAARVVGQVRHQRLVRGERPRLQPGEDLVEPLAVDRGLVLGQRVIGARRRRPVAAFLVEGAQELAGVGRGPFRVEHVVEAGEGVAVPAVVDLDAAHVEGFPPLPHAVLREGQRLLARLEPVALALAVDRPGKGAHPAAGLAAGLGQGDGLEHLGRDAGAPGAVDDGPFAERGVRILLRPGGKGGERRKRRRQRRDERSDHGGASPPPRS